MKRLLMVAFHFPPLAGSSGIQRTLRLVQQLPSHGWQPLVLTAAPMAYERVANDLMGDVPPETIVERAFALDAQRHLALGGRYLGFTARPDRWISWKLDAVRVGMRMVREHRPDALWSTYPIATAHAIGAELHRRSGLPWVADFRDPMLQSDYPVEPATRTHFKKIEEAAILQARLSLFTTPSAARTFRARYPTAADRIHVLENGYDEPSFAQLESRLAAAPTSKSGGPRVLLHSGTIYPSERDPTQLMQALQRLHAAGVINPGLLRVRFRAAIHDALLMELAHAHGVTDYVEVGPPVGYGDALDEMLRVDGLLLLQAANCNEQVPAKAYEYMRAGRPVLCLTDPAGDTAAVLRDAGIRKMARLDSADEIADLLTVFLSDGHQGLLPSPSAVAAASRDSRTAQLARWLDGL